MSKKDTAEEALQKALKLRTSGEISTLEMMQFARPIVALKLELENKQKRSQTYRRQQ